MFRVNEKCYISEQNIKLQTIVKGTVSVISNDPLYKDGNDRFTTVPLKTLFDHV